MYYWLLAGLPGGCPIAPLGLAGALPPAAGLPARMLGSPQSVSPHIVELAPCVLPLLRFECQMFAVFTLLSALKRLSSVRTLPDSTNKETAWAWLVVGQALSTKIDATEERRSARIVISFRV